MTALYRTYRPQDFDDVVGQEAVVRTLRNAIELGQLRQAYLFAGPRGTGTTALCAADSSHRSFAQPLIGTS